MNKLLVVVDMVNGFVNEGNLADKNINRIVPNIEKLINQAINHGDKIVAFVDTHKKGDPEFERFPEHCIAGSRECELVPELKKYFDQMIMIEKNTTNGFNTQKFKRLILVNNFSEIKVCGCCTDICVKDFTQSVLRFLKATSSRTQVKIVADACDTFGKEGHEPNAVNLETLKELQKKGAIITKTKEKTDEKNY